MTAVTVRGPTSDEAERVEPAFVYVRKLWTDDWEFRPDLEMVELTQTIAAFDLSSCTIRRKYGITKQPYESDTSTVAQIDLDDWWVQIRLIGPQDSAGGDDLEQETVVWTGQIQNQVREVWGSDSEPSGFQEWVAHGPENLLRKIEIDGSYWDDPDSASVLKMDWTPDMNARDKLRMLVGNRTSGTMANGAYAFGGTSTWTRKQFADYLIVNFVSATDWTIGARGSTGLFASMNDMVPIRTGDSVWTVLNRLINPQIGLAWRVVVREKWNQFEIDIFTLTAEDKSFGDVTLGANTNVTEVQADDKDVAHARIVRSRDQMYDEIRVVGKRAIVCCTVSYADSTLEKGWKAATETSYKAGTGDAADEPRDHDRARQRDEWRAVYCKHVAPATWDYAHGPIAGQFLPNVDDNGQIVGPEPGSQPAHQLTVRKTLRVLPMLEGYDYKQVPPADNNPAGQSPDFLPIQVFMKPFYAEWLSLSHWTPIDLMGVGVRALQNDWGVMLTPKPNHQFGLNHWAGAKPTGEQLMTDYERIYVTFATEIDARVKAVWRRPGALTTDKRLKVIEVSNAEYWYLAAGVVVGVSLAGVLQTTGQDAVLRDDSARLQAILAGAIVRYGEPRCRGTIQYAKMRPMTDLVGGFLKIVETKGDSETINAPVTAVTLTPGTGPNDPGTTTIKTGFAE